jgi:hypothetical protein
MVRKVVSRVLVAGAVGAVALGLGGGVAGAAEETPIWVVPGVDAGSLLAPTVSLPTSALSGLDGLLGFLAG